MCKFYGTPSEHFCIGVGGNAISSAALTRSRSNAVNRARTNLKVPGGPTFYDCSADGIITIGPVGVVDEPRLCERHGLGHHVPRDVLDARVRR